MLPFRDRVKTWDFLPEIMDAVEQQLQQDDKRKGDLWLQLPREGQEERIFARFMAYYRDYKERGTPIPWTKIIGNAVIALIRERHPELFNR